MTNQKQVTIEIDPNDLQTLKDNGYQLCFAKKVNEGDYDVVWNSYSNYLEYNDFSWMPQYQIFGTNTFEDGVTVMVATNLVDIGIGEIVTLNNYGIIDPPSTSNSPTTISLNDQYGAIHVGLNQLSTGIDGLQVSTPMYVTQQASVMGQVSLTPVDKVLIWFEQNIETSMMFNTARSEAIEIDLTNSDSAKCLYQAGSWSTPS